MNNPTPLVPQGIIDPKNKRRARVKIGVFFVLAVHGAGLLALLLQGCHREDGAAQAANQNTNAVAPPFDPTPLPSTTEAANTATNANPTPQVTPQLPEQGAPPAASTLAGTGSEYKIASGDKLSTIAKKFNVSLNALRDANPGIEPTKLQIGKTLHVPAPAPKAALGAVNSTPPAGAATATETAGGAQVHTVKSGETLIKIAMLNHTTVKAIRSANNLKSDRITVGQKIKIPAKSASTASTETASANPQLTSAIPAH